MRGLAALMFVGAGILGAVAIVTLLNANGIVVFSSH
jgi:hypothetical protein